MDFIGPLFILAAIFLAVAAILMPLVVIMIWNRLIAMHKTLNSMSDIVRTYAFQSNRK
jgi:hypothetical protein